MGNIETGKTGIIMGLYKIVYVKKKIVYVKLLKIPKHYRIFKNLSFNEK